MLLLFIYVSIAVGFSFLCSVAEAVLLSTTTSYIANAERNKKAYATTLRKLKNDINSPLAVILTLNTIAHTIGAAGAGAQAVAVFGSVYLGIFSGVLTLIILVFSEIIPKALGAHYWRKLAPITAYTLKFLIRALYPFVWLSNRLTRGLTAEPTLRGFTRQEFSAMAELGEKEGQLEKQESRVLQNLFRLRDAKVRSAMTPRPVVFAMQEDRHISELLDKKSRRKFSRIPIFSSEETITGFVLRDDLLVAQAEGRSEAQLRKYRRDLKAVPESLTLLQAFEDMIRSGAHIFLVVNEYGDTQGIITLEDILETLLGLEIVDESDTVQDMQILAKRLSSIRRQRLKPKED